MRQRIKRLYQTRILQHLCEKFHYRNVHQVPRFEKIVVNRGLGELATRTKILESCLSEMTIITGQRGVVTVARTAISGFGIRRKAPVGLKVTLRGDRIYDFFDRLVNLALPRIRDFRGINSQTFDGHGNYNFGLSEQLMFPEIFYDQVDKLCGMDISIVTTSPTDDERKVLLDRFGIPFLH